MIIPVPEFTDYMPEQTYIISTFNITDKVTAELEVLDHSYKNKAVLQP